MAKRIAYAEIVRNDTSANCSGGELAPFRLSAAVDLDTSLLQFYADRIRRYTEMVEPIEVTFGTRTQVSRRNHVLGGVGIPQGKGRFSWGNFPAHCKVYM